MSRGRYEQQGELMREARRLNERRAPDFNQLWKPYVWRPRSLNELRASCGLRPVQTQVSISEAMRRSWARRKAEFLAEVEKPLNPQIVVVVNQQAEIVPLPDDGIEYTSSGIPIGVTMVRPHSDN